MKTNSFEAIIFDHDGTLVDTENPDFEACKMLCAEFKITLTIEYWGKKVMDHADGYNILFQEIMKTNNNSITHNKPSPDIYRFVAAQLNVHPKRCLVFEDSLPGLQAAKAAGMTVVAVPNHISKSLDFSQADRVIDSLKDVTLKWIEDLGYI